MSFIVDLSNYVYTPEGIEAAKTYAKGRKLDPEAFSFPWTISGSDPDHFRIFKHLYPPWLFTDSLFIPVVDFEDGQTLVAFDVRYLGNDPKRSRYMKFKTDKTQPILYFTRPLEAIADACPIIVCEGAVDAESLRFMGYPVISPLTALHGLRFLAFLRAISKNIYFAYDNDAGGMQAKQKIQEECSFDPEFSNQIRFLSFPGKDINDSVKAVGRDYLKQFFNTQIIDTRYL